MRRVIAEVGSKAGAKARQLLSAQLLSAPILAVIALLAVTTPAAADKRVALVIGNAIHERAPLLDEPAADARLLAETLTRLGFTLSGGAAQIDLTKQGFDRALAEFKGRIADADVALIYYAGYGLNQNGSNYLVPVDAAPTKTGDLASELRDLNAVLRELAGSNRRQNVVILDAFRSNPFEARGIAGLAAGLSPARVPARTLIAFAAQPGTIGQRGSDGHSVFAAALAQALQQQDRRLIEVFNQTGQTVERQTNGAQQPLVMFTQIESGTVPGPVTPQPSPPAAPVARQSTDAPSRPAAGLAELAPQDARTPGMAVLFDEDPTDPAGKRYPGSVVWRNEIIRDPKSGAQGLAIKATIDIPARRLTFALKLSRNDDPALPASHVAELTVTVPPDFAGGGIKSVPGILAKTSESARGTPFAGLSVKISDNMFLVGLSNVDADRERNEQLLGGREWFDIPLVYSNGRRAILAIAKGPSGDKAFADALVAWAKPAAAK